MVTWRVPETRWPCPACGAAADDAKCCNEQYATNMRARFRPASACCAGTRARPVEERSDTPWRGRERPRPSRSNAHRPSDPARYTLQSHPRDARIRADTARRRVRFHIRSPATDELRNRWCRHRRRYGHCIPNLRNSRGRRATNGLRDKPRRGPRETHRHGSPRPGQGRQNRSPTRSPPRPAGHSPETSRPAPAMRKGSPPPRQRHHRTSRPRWPA